MLSQIQKPLKNQKTVTDMNQLDVFLFCFNFRLAQRKLPPSSGLHLGFICLLPVSAWRLSTCSHLFPPCLLVPAWEHDIRSSFELLTLCHLSSALFVAFVSHFFNESALGSTCISQALKFQGRTETVVQKLPETLNVNYTGSSSSLIEPFFSLESSGNSLLDF